MENIRVQVNIDGFVHGVFFRSHIKSQANLKGIKGWVKNVPDGVEALFEGEREKVEELISFCREGPKGATVTEVNIKESEYTGEFKTFEIVEEKAE